MAAVIFVRQASSLRRAVSVIHNLFGCANCFAVAATSEHSANGSPTNLC
jgi:hypothetical protein